MVVIAVLEKLLTELKAEHKKAIGDMLTGGDVEAVRTPTDGVLLGKVRADHKPGGWAVVDSKAWLAWVRKVAAGRIIEQTTTTYSVDPEYTEEVTSQLASGFPWHGIDPATGEVLDTPPGFALVKPSTSVVVTPDKGAPAVLRDLLGPRLLELEAGQS